MGQIKYLGKNKLTKILADPTVFEISIEASFLSRYTVIKINAMGTKLVMTNPGVDKIGLVKERIHDMWSTLDVFTTIRKDNSGILISYSDGTYS